MSKYLLTVVAFATLCFGVVPIARADTLPNGYDVTCSANGTKPVCHVSGCPRVYEDEAADVIHAYFNALPQDEIGYGCNGTIEVDGNVNASAPFTLTIQGCHKNKLSSDDCGRWSTYSYTPPAPAPPPSKVPVNENDPIRCTGCASPVAPPPPAPDVTNAIQANFGQPGLGSVDFFVTNTSKLDATCHYTATANTLNPVVPKKTTRQFNVPANGNVTETFNGAPTLTTYNVTLSCSDASGKQKAELGHVDTSVLW